MITKTFFPPLALLLPPAQGNYLQLTHLASCAHISMNKKIGSEHAQSKWSRLSYRGMGMGRAAVTLYVCI